MGAEPRFRPAATLVQRRLQCYLALIVSDTAALFSGFGGSGYLYLGWHGVEQAAVLAQLVLPIFLTVALYNGAYSLQALKVARAGSFKALIALAISASAVVFIAFYTKSSADFSRLLFSAGVIFTVFGLLWTRAQMRSFIAWQMLTLPPGNYQLSWTAQNGKAPATGTQVSLSCALTDRRPVAAIAEPNGKGRFSAQLVIDAACPGHILALWQAPGPDLIRFDDLAITPR